MSIGLPVFNGDRYLQATLDSILAQTYQDFELVISDNASTDATRAICETYAAHDRRIRYYSNPTNLGAGANYDRVLALASGEYFKWAAHDDILGPGFLERCVEVLEHDPTVILAHPRVKVIDERGREVGAYVRSLPRCGSPRAGERFAEFVLSVSACYQIFGVVRSDVLRQAPCMANVVESDVVLLAELALRGRFYEVPEYLLFSRDHTGRYSRMPAPDIARWWNPAFKGRPVLLRWKRFGELLKAIRRVPLDPMERLRCYASMGRWLAANHNWTWMLIDLSVALAPRSWNVIQPHVFKGRLYKRDYQYYQGQGPV